MMKFLKVIFKTYEANYIEKCSSFKNFERDFLKTSLYLCSTRCVCNIFEWNFNENILHDIFRELTGFFQFFILFFYDMENWQILKQNYNLLFQVT